MIYFKIGAMLDMTKLCSLRSVLMTLTSRKVTGLRESENLCNDCCFVARSSPNFNDR